MDFNLSLMQKRIRNHVNPLSITHEYQFEGFENDHPIIVDVGSCKGEFAAALIDKFPNKNFVLFEIRVPLREKLEEQFKDFSNVKVFGGDAGRNFKSILKPSIDRGVHLETVYLNFPDPWFKEKHKKRRFLNSKFLEEVRGYIRPETEFVFQTDQQFLFDETLAMMRECGITDIHFFDEPPYGVRTDWECATMALGRSISRMRFTINN